MSAAVPILRILASVAALALCSGPLAAVAQDQPASGGGEPAASPGTAPAENDSGSGERGRHRRGAGRATSIEPYVAVQQVGTAEISPGSDFETYTQLAVGVDASLAGRNNAGSLSLQYERQIGWGSAADGDIVSGVARGHAAIVPGALRVEVGGLAAHARTQGAGAALSSAPAGDGSTDIYGVFAGPALSTYLDDVKVDAHYRFGFTKVEDHDSLVPAPGAAVADIFDKSTVHDAELHLGARPHTLLPVGLGAGVGYYREDISNFDQRVEDLHARGDVLVPVSLDLALVGGVGYEKVRISSRDALTGADGLPLFAGGRYLTDKSAPRRLAYDVEGLIWDAGVIWRPSRRTQLEAHVGRRYGTTSYFGSFSYAPNDRSALNVAVYDNVAGFGGQLNRALADLPAEFTANRNPINGNVTGCVASLEGNGCVGGVFGSLRSATFRARGVAVSYNLDLGRISTGIGGGYDRRKFIAAPGTVLAVANGIVDENWWLTAYLNGRIDQRSGWSANLYANWFHSGSSFDGDLNVIGATASYYRRLARNLTANAAIGLEGVNRDEPFDDLWSASGLVGLRYSF